MYVDAPGTSVTAPRFRAFVARPILKRRMTQFDATRRANPRTQAAARMRYAVIFASARSPFFSACEFVLQNAVGDPICALQSSWWPLSTLHPTLDCRETLAVARHASPLIVIGEGHVPAVRHSLHGRDPRKEDGARPGSLYRPAHGRGRRDPPSHRTAGTEHRPRSDRILYRLSTETVQK